MAEENKLLKIALGVLKHGGGSHDQMSHGNWASGRGGSSKEPQSAYGKKIFHPSVAEIPSGKWVSEGRYDLSVAESKKVWGLAQAGTIPHTSTADPTRREALWSIQRAMWQIQRGTHRKVGSSRARKKRYTKNLEKLHKELNA